MKAENLTYVMRGSRALHLDIYRPDDEQTYPAVILVHGGGWVTGNRAKFSSMSHDLAQRGYVVANIEYRLAKEAKFPGAVQDVKAAMQWVRQNAATYNLDPEAISGVGFSAGGHLIAMAALTPDDHAIYDANDDMAATGELQAYIVMGSGVDQVSRAKSTPLARHKTMIAFFGGTYQDIPEIYVLGSPITHITPNAPPVLLLDGSKDRPGERYKDFIPKLKENDVPYAFQIIEGAKHGQWNTPEFQDAYISVFNEFLSEHLKRSE